MWGFLVDDRPHNISLDSVKRPLYIFNRILDEGETSMMRQPTGLFMLAVGVLIGLVAVTVFSSQFIASPERHYADLSLVQGDSVILYRRYCQVCHGERGDGRGPAGVAMRPSPTNFLTMPNTTSAEYIYQAMTRGKGSMPAFGNLLNEANRRSIALYIRDVFIPKPRRE